jgi:hypothetical protein
LKPRDESACRFVQALRSFAGSLDIKSSRGDIVMIHGRHSGLGPKPMVIVDIFRIVDGNLVAHCDVVQDEVPASETKSGNPMFAPVNYGK